jgi:hypothetical protein
MQQARSERSKWLDAPPPFASNRELIGLRNDAGMGLYTTNIATPAANIPIVVRATTIHPRRELG